MGRKTPQRKEVITSLENFNKSTEGVFNFFRDYTEMVLDSNYKAKEVATKGTGLKILTPKQLLQRLRIALAQ